MYFKDTPGGDSGGSLRVSQIRRISGIIPMDKV